MKEKFEGGAFESELHELSILFLDDGNMETLFDWYNSSAHEWEYGSQQRFLRWVEKEEKKRAMNSGEKPLSKDAIRKRYQRNQRISPEQRTFRLERREKILNIRVRNLIENLIASSYDYFATYDDYGDVFMPESSKKAIREILENTRRKISMISEKSRQYRLNTTLISAYGIWINSDTFRSQMPLLRATPLGKEILEDQLQSLLSSIEASDDVKEPLRKNKTILPTLGSYFFVFSGSQMVKEAKKSGKSNERINKKREELINLGIVDVQDQFYVFKKSYPFSSPSMAASVLLGMNANGQVFWRDDQGRTFRELHPKFDKIKRGPGRPKKSS